MKGFVLFWLTLAGPLAHATTPDMTYDSAIRALVEQYQIAWNTHDSSLLRAMTTEDVVFVSADGTKWRGREEVVQQHAKRHQARSRSSLWLAEQVRVQVLRFETGLVHIDWVLHGDLDSDGLQRGPLKGFSMWVVVKDNRAVWRIHAAQDTETQ